jgi:hypothetical protein
MLLSLLAAVSAVAAALWGRDLLAKAVPQTPVEKTAYVHLSPDRDATPELGTETPAPDKPASWFLWRQKVHAGGLDEEEVRRVLDANRAERLEYRLKPEFRDQLLAQTAEVETTLKELVPVYTAAVDHVRKELIARGEVVRIRTQPREADPNYPALIQARQEIENRGKGAIWGSRDTNGDEVHILLRWADWPDIDRIRETQVSLVLQRNAIARRVIPKLFETHGMGIFAH